MEKLTEAEVSEAVRAWLGEDSLVEVSRDDPEGRITGWVMSPAFAEVSHADRQSWLWSGYGEEGALQRWPGLRGTFNGMSTQIGLILTYSPLEYETAFGKSA